MADGVNGKRTGKLIERTRGTPQGGVISPILANLFLHYTFDLWMARTHPDLTWCRYADDGLVHCRTEQEAEAIRAELQARLEVCGLQMHPTKTRDRLLQGQQACDERIRTSNSTSSDISSGRGGWRTSQRTEFFCGYTPAVSPTALKSMRATIRSLHIPRQTSGTLAEIARADQSAPPGVDRLLRPVQSFGAGLSGRLRQSEAEGLDHAKVQALPVPQNPCFSVLAKAGAGKCGTLRTLAVVRNDHVHLMGAV